MQTLRPMTSSAPYPNRRSAAALKHRTIPWSSMIIIASGAVSSTDRRCASRSSSVVCVPSALASERRNAVSTRSRSSISSLQAMVRFD